MAARSVFGQADKTTQARCISQRTRDENRCLCYSLNARGRFALRIVGLLVALYRERSWKKYCRQECWLKRKLRQHSAVRWWSGTAAQWPARRMAEMLWH